MTTIDDKLNLIILELTNLPLSKETIVGNRCLIKLTKVINIAKLK